MYSLAVERSRWLAELAQAVDDAQLLLRQLPASLIADDEALDLGTQLESVAKEVEALRRGRGEFAPAASAPQANRALLL